MNQAADLVQEELLKRFDALLKDNVLAHAYLFVGPALSGKSETALEIAKLLNCDHPAQGHPCNECPSCKKIIAQNHPDIYIFEAITKEEDDDGLIRPKLKDAKEKSQNNQEIRIGQIRYLSSKVQLRPYEAQKKVFIVKSIEKLNDQAANAFLKTLEEPTASSLIILTTTAPDKIADTVKSRCQKIYFAPLGAAELKKKLIQLEGVDQEGAHFLAHLSEGSFGKAISLNDSRVIQRKNKVINRFIFERDSESYLQNLALDKEKTKEAFDILLTWFRDLMLIKSGVEEIKLINLDRAKDLKKMSALYAFDELETAVSQITQTSYILSENLNMKITMTLLKEQLWRN